MKGGAYEVKIRAVGGGYVTGTDGKRYKIIGDYPFQKGETVWTDGAVVFGHIPRRSSPVTVIDDCAIPYYWDEQKQNLLYFNTRLKNYSLSCSNIAEKYFLNDGSLLHWFSSENRLFDAEVVDGGLVQDDNDEMSDDIVETLKEKAIDAVTDKISLPGRFEWDDDSVSLTIEKHSSQIYLDDGAISEIWFFYGKISAVSVEGAGELIGGSDAPACVRSEQKDNPYGDGVLYDETYGFGCYVYTTDRSYYQHKIYFAGFAVNNSEKINIFSLKAESSDSTYPFGKVAYVDATVDSEWYGNLWDGGLWDGHVHSDGALSGTYNLLVIRDFFNFHVMANGGDLVGLSWGVGYTATFEACDDYIKDEVYLFPIQDGFSFELRGYVWSSEYGYLLVVSFYDGETKICEFDEPIKVRWNSSYFAAVKVRSDVYLIRIGNSIYKLVKGVATETDSCNAFRLRRIKKSMLTKGITEG